MPPWPAAGFRRGDRILEIDERPVRDNFDALDTVLDLSIGAALPVRIVGHWIHDCLHRIHCPA